MRSLDTAVQVEAALMDWQHAVHDCDLPMYGKTGMEHLVRAVCGAQVPAGRAWINGLPAHLARSSWCPHCREALGPGDVLAPVAGT